jgi:hypothetical protein
MRRLIVALALLVAATPALAAEATGSVAVDPQAKVKAALVEQQAKNSALYKRLAIVQFQLDDLEKQKAATLTEVTAGEVRAQALAETLQP